jgi:hypothetical protein
VLILASSDGIVPLNWFLSRRKSRRGSLVREEGRVPENMLSPRWIVSNAALFRSKCSGNVPSNWLNPSLSVLRLDIMDHDSGIDPRMLFCSTMMVERSVKRAISNGKVPTKSLPKSLAIQGFQVSLQERDIRYVREKTYRKTRDQRFLHSRTESQAMCTHLHSKARWSHRDPPRK